MDGSTDTDNIDDEMFLVLWCDVDHDDNQFTQTRTTFVFLELRMKGF